MLRRVLLKRASPSPLGGGAVHFQSTTASNNNDPTTTSSNLLVQKIEESVLNSPCRTATECARSITMLSQVYSKNQQAINTIVGRSERIHFPPAQLVAFCTAIARGGLLDRMPSFVQTNLQTSDLKKFTDHQLATLLATFALVGKTNTQVGDLVANELGRRKLDEFSASDFAAMLNSLFSVGASAETNNRFCVSVARELKSREDWGANACPLEDMSMLVRDFTALGYTMDVDLFQRFAEECAKRQFKEKTVSEQIALLASFARVRGGVQCLALCSTISTELQQRAGKEFRNTDFALVFKYFASLGYGEDESLCEKFSRELVQQQRDLSSLRGFDFAVILSYLQTGALKDLALMQRFSSELKQRANLKDFSGQELEYTLLCYDFFEFQDVDLYQCIVRDLVERNDLANRFTMKNLANIVACIPQQQQLQDELLKALSVHVLQERNWSEFDTDDLLYLLDMFTHAKELPHAILDRFAQHVLDKPNTILADFTNTDLANMLGLFARYRAKQQQPYHNTALGNALAFSCNQRNVTEFTLEELSQCLEGLESLQFDNPALAMKFLTNMTNRLDAMTATTMKKT